MKLIWKKKTAKDVKEEQKRSKNGAKPSKNGGKAQEKRRKNGGKTAKMEQGWNCYEPQMNLK